MLMSYFKEKVKNIDERVLYEERANWIQSDFHGF